MPRSSYLLPQYGLFAWRLHNYHTFRKDLQKIFLSLIYFLIMRGWTHVFTVRSILLFGVLYCRTLDYSSSHSADTSILINWFLSFKIIRSCFTFRFYYIAGLKGQIDILVSFIMPLLIILRASPLCRIARHVRRTIIIRNWFHLPKVYHNKCHEKIKCFLKTGY